MSLRDYPVRTQIPVTDIDRATQFYQDTLGLRALRSGPSAKIPNGMRIYGSGGEPALIIYQTIMAASKATVATWFVDDIDAVVTELAQRGVEFVRYDDFDHDDAGITARAGGGRIAWFSDPDGNTFAIEADT